MKLIRANFATQSRPGRRHWQLLAVLTTVLFVTVFLAKSKVQEAQSIHLMATGTTIPSRDDPRGDAHRPVYDASAREMLSESRSTWPSVLVALETVHVAGVRPIALEVVAASRHLSLQVQFRDHAALMRYLGELNAGEPSPRWTLLQAQSGGALPGRSTAQLNAKLDP